MIEKEQPFGLSTDELDLILLEQLHQARRNKKTLKRVRKLLKNDPAIDKGEEYIDGRITFFETMIQNKSLLSKKQKKKKRNKDPDILARNPFYEVYRQALYVTVFGYKMITDSVSSYMSYFKKGKD
jgi:CRISPR/Cas system-associated protein Cas5 (RAMP superfamily)